jgi:hypothetical protein
MRLILLLSLIACDGAPSSDDKDDTDATPIDEETVASGVCRCAADARQ